MSCSGDEATTASARLRFCVEQVGDALLERARAHERVHHDTAGLADAPHAVRRLVLDRGVPPAVEVDDVVGPHEVQAGATGLERHAQHRRPAVDR